MISKATTPKEYLDELPEDRAKVMKKLRKVIADHLPDGFKEEMSYGMIGYVVPHSLYPKGYHTNPKLPLPFMSIGSQKNYIALHHMGVYANPELLEWFTLEYPKYSKTKLDMGKGCIRLKKMEDVPYELIGQLASKLTVKQWVAMYEQQFKKK